MYQIPQDHRKTLISGIGMKNTTWYLPYEIVIMWRRLTLVPRNSVTRKMRLGDMGFEVFHRVLVWLWFAYLSSGDP